MKIQKGKLNLKLTQIFLIILLVNGINTSKCGADKLKLKPAIINSTNIYDKKATASGYQPIKIGADFTSFTKPNSMDTNIFNKVKNLILDTFEEFQKFLKTQHQDIDLSGHYKTIKERCEIDEIASDYKNFLKTNDIIVFPTFDNSLDEGVIAAAGHCLTSDTGRPVAGTLLINPKLSFDIVNTETYMKNLLLHEITHILIFSPYLFSSLGMLSSKNSVYYVTSPKALLKARQHFNCGTLNGIPLENQGGKGSVGSHWEARYMLGDYMISTVYYDNTISDITLALFEDSGFYQVNYYSGGLFKFGKNKGCGFINQKCIVNGKPISDEFCTQPDEPKCLQTRTYKGFCSVRDYSLYGYKIPTEYQYFSNPNYGGFIAANFCPIANADNSDTDFYPESCKIGTSTLHSDYGEKIGDNSFCFVSSLLPKSSTQKVTSQSICYEVQCNSEKENIIVKIGSTSVTCPTSGGTMTVDGFSGSITCPKYSEICDFKKNVVCNEMFDCLSKKVEVDPDSYEFDEDDENFSIIKTRYRSNSNNLKKRNLITLFLLLIYLF